MRWMPFRTRRIPRSRVIFSTQQRDVGRPHRLTCANSYFLSPGNRNAGNSLLRAGYPPPADADFRTHQSLMTPKGRHGEQQRFVIGGKINWPSAILYGTMGNFPYSEHRTRALIEAASYPMLSILRFGGDPTRDLV